MDIRRPKSPALPPSPGALVGSKSRSSAAITLPDNNSCPPNTSQRLAILRSKSRTTKNKDEENLNPSNCKTKAGFAKFLKSSPATSPSAWALSPGRSLGSPLVPPLQTVADGGRGKLGGHRGGGAVSGVLRFFRPKKAAVEAEELRRFRILQNRLLQWKYANGRAETSMANVRTLAQADIKTFQQALNIAMEVMAKLEATITKNTYQQLEITLYLLTERLSIFKEQEDCLEKLEEAVCSVTTLLAKEISVRIQLIQATKVNC